jgi:hypothetical protein
MSASDEPWRSSTPFSSMNSELSSPGGGREPDQADILRLMTRRRRIASILRAAANKELWCDHKLCRLSRERQGLRHLCSALQGVF